MKQMTNKSVFKPLENKAIKAEIVFPKLLPKNRPFKGWDSIKGEALKSKVKLGGNLDD